jgi:hypothetical protein
LPPVSLTPAASNGKLVAGIVDSDGIFATGFNNTSGTGCKICLRCIGTGGGPWLVNISAHFLKKVWNEPNVIFRGLGEDDSWKKPKAKNLMTLSLQEDKINDVIATKYVTVDKDTKHEFVFLGLVIIWSQNWNA